MIVKAISTVRPENPAQDMVSIFLDLSRPFSGQFNGTFCGLFGYFCPTRGPGVSEAAGDDAQRPGNRQLTTDGQNRLNTGQNPSNTGQPLGLPQRVSDGQVSNTGQDKSISGHNLAPKWPQRIEPDCVEIVDAWRDLPDAIKAGIMAMVRRS
jgi:hypothetical protein